MLIKSYILRNIIISYLMYLIFCLILGFEFIFFRKIVYISKIIYVKKNQETEFPD